MATPGTNIQVWSDWEDDTFEEEKGFNEFASDFLKLKSGKTQLRVVPPPAVKGQKSPFVKTFQHFIELVKGNKDTIAKFNCPKRMAKQRCPACEKYDQLKKSGRPGDDIKAKIFFAKPRVYAAVIDRKDEENPSIQTWAFGSQIWDQMMELRDDYGNFTHPLSGRDIIVRKVGENRDTEYKLRASDEKSPLVADAKVMAALAESYPDLTAHATVPSYEDCREAIQKAAKAARGADDDDDAQRSRKSAKSSKPANDGWDDEEDVKPRGKVSKLQSDDWGSDAGAIDTDGETVGDNPLDDDIPF